MENIINRYIYIPRDGIDLLKFGMSRAEVISILGDPEESISFDTNANSNPVKEVAEDAGYAEIYEEVISQFKNQEIDVYPQSQGKTNTQSISEVISEAHYYKGELSKVRLIDCQMSIMLNSINLCEENLKTVLTELFKVSDKIYEQSVFFYFPDIGLQICYDEDVERIIVLLDGRTEELAMRSGAYERVKPEEMVEFLEDEDEE